ESGTLGKVRVSLFSSDYGNRRCKLQFSQRPAIVDRLSRSLEVSINRLRACVSEHIFVGVFWPVSGQRVCTSLGLLFDLWVLYVPCLQHVRIKLYLFGVLCPGPWTSGIVSHTSLIDSPVTHLSFFLISCETHEYMIFGWIRGDGCHNLVSERVPSRDGDQGIRFSMFSKNIYNKNNNNKVFQIARRFISFSNHYAEVVHDLICDVSSTTQFQAIAPRIFDA
ncbi:hypothetical protein IGI04_023471, partial [Brassica rapa subsp. trilocularis]